MTNSEKKIVSASTEATQAVCAQTARGKTRQTPLASGSRTVNLTSKLYWIQSKWLFVGTIGIWNRTKPTAILKDTQNKGR